jgi:uncharacterized protein (DUF2336 family)
LEASISQKNIGSRAEILRQITDLFVAGSGYFDGEQMALFDVVMDRLVNEIDNSARVVFGETIAGLANSPPKVTRTLALDDSIDVAGPVLRRSECLDDETLIEGAKTKGQDHLLAISQRTRLSEGVTDVLVERGNQKVIIALLPMPARDSLSSATPPWSHDPKTIPSLRCWSGRVLKFPASSC